MGVTPVWVGEFPRLTHRDAIAAVFELFALAGIDDRTDEGFEHAQVVLQECPVSHVPAALATIIADRIVAVQNHPKAVSRRAS